MVYKIEKGGTACTAVLGSQSEKSLWLYESQKDCLLFLYHIDIIKGDMDSDTMEGSGRNTIQLFPSDVLDVGSFNVGRGRNKHFA